MKRLVGILAVCLFFFNVPAFASPVTMDGTWNVNGRVTVTGTMPGLLSLKATLLRNKEITDTFVFASGTFSSESFGTIAPYTIAGNGCANMDISGFLELLKEDLLTNLPNGSTITYSKQIFHFKPIGMNKAKGILAVDMQVNMTTNNQLIATTVTATFDFNGVRSVKDAAFIKQDTDALNVISNFITKKAINPILALIDKGNVQKTLRKISTKK